MKRFKTGLQPFRHNLVTPRLMAVMRSHLAALGTPPPASQPYGDMYEKATGDPTWGGMLANGPDPNNPSQEPDGLGDCVICDDLRGVSLWTALGTGPLYTPTTADAIALYEASTGFNPSDPNSDQGADPVTNANYMQQTGFKGYKIDGWAPLLITDLDHVKWANQIFGNTKFCWNLPDIAEDMFDSGVWDYTGQSYNIEGGHDTIEVQYYIDPKYGLCFDVVTWGKRIKVTQAFVQQFLANVIAPYSKLFVGSNGVTPAGFNVNQMQQDLVLVQN